MGFRWMERDHETPWEALVDAWRALTRCPEQGTEELRQQAADCDAATRLVSAQEDAGGLPAIRDTQRGDGAQAPTVPFDWDEHIAAVMEAAERTVTERTGPG
ncbi:MAG: hypothetical protein ACLFSJ_05415 [Halorhodospira sp.]